MISWSDDIDPTTIPDEVLKTERGRRNAALRKTHAGGRPRSKKRCPCGKFTAKRAKSRGHKCEKENT